MEREDQKNVEFDFVDCSTEVDNGQYDDLCEWERRNTMNCGCHEMLLLILSTWLTCIRRIIIGP